MTKDKDPGMVEAGAIHPDSGVSPSSEREGD